MKTQNKSNLTGSTVKLFLSLMMLVTPTQVLLASYWYDIVPENREKIGTLHFINEVTFEDRDVEAMFYLGKIFPLQFDDDETTEWIPHIKMNDWQKNTLFFSTGVDCRRCDYHSFWTDITVNSPNKARISSNAMYGEATIDGVRGSVSLAPVPIPATLPLILSGLAFAGFLSRKRKPQEPNHRCAKPTS